MIPKWVISFVDGLRGLLKIPAVWIDGTLYVSIAIFGVLQTSFASEEAVKFITPEKLFWTKTIIGAMASGALALKMFRSNPKPAEVPPKEPSGVTEFFAKPPEPKP